MAGLRSSSLRLRVASLLLGALVIACSIWAWHGFLRPIPPVDEPGEEFLGWVDVGVPMPSVRIAWVRRNYVMPNIPIMRYIHGRERSDLWDPLELRGLVRISEPRHALNWARFADRFRERREVRISDHPADPDLVPHTQAKNKGPMRYYTLGELAPADFRAGEFTEARVVAMWGSFEVNRWVYCPRMDQPGTVRHLRETVLPDGGYSFKVLSERPAPKLPGVRWGEMHPLM